MAAVRALPKAQLVELTGLGHVPTLTRPAAVAEASETFFSSATPGAEILAPARQRWTVTKEATMQVLSQLEAQRPWLSLIQGGALILLVGFLDWLTGYELAFSLFYLLPIGMLSWLAGRRVGLIGSVFSAAIWLIADWASGQLYSHPGLYIWNTAVRLSFFVIVTLLLAELRRALHHEREMARSDSLTGAINARRFNEVLTNEIARAKRYRHPFTLAYIDVDNFKAVNDRYGHSTGDALLISIVKTLQDHLRQTDSVARLGGDEFALLLPEADQAAAQAALHKVRLQLDESMQRHHWPITFSIGAVTCLTPPASVDEAIKLADHLMYAVKDSTKDAVRFLVFPG